MVSGCVMNGDDFTKCLQQSRSMCKARIPAYHFNGKVFGGDDSVLTLTFTKSTKMIQVQGSATLLDKAEETLKKIMAVYSNVLRGGEVLPLPDGCQKWGTAIKESLDSGSISHYLESLRAEDTKGDSSIVKTEMVKKQILVPEDEAFQAAVADLCNEGARKLFHYPAWRNKFLQFTLQEFNASTDQVLELAELAESLREQETVDQWTFEEGPMTEGPMTEAKPKARSDGYRPHRGTQAKKEF